MALKAVAAMVAEGVEWSQLVTDFNDGFQLESFAVHAGTHIIEQHAHKSVHSRTITLIRTERLVYGAMHVSKYAHRNAPTRMRACLITKHLSLPPFNSASTISRMMCVFSIAIAVGLL